MNSAELDHQDPFFEHPASQDFLMAADEARLMGQSAISANALWLLRQKHELLRSEAAALAYLAARRLADAATTFGDDKEDTWPNAI